jgi:hypothetical protein
MLKGHNFIYFGPEKWYGLWRNRHQLMSRFSQNNKVVYVEPLMRLKKLRRSLYNKDIYWNEILKDIKTNRVTKLNKNLYIFHSPLYTPVSNRSLLKKLTLYFWKNSLKKVLDKLCIENPIIWISRPSCLDLVSKFDKKLIIYHVVDEYSAYSNIDFENKKRIQKQEQKISEKADMIITVSKSLYDSKRALNNHTYLVPNAVDYHAFARALNSEKQLPTDISCLPRPIIGYSGLIASKLDFNLLKYMSEAHPNWSIAMVGFIKDKYCEFEIKLLKQSKNVHFLGLKNIDKIPYYIKAFDVCIAPYKINEHSRNMSPLKIYDYLATGKPVVTTNFTASYLFKEVIKIAKSKEEFIKHVKDSLSENNNNLILRRRNIASKNTWEQRVESISQIIKSHI